MSDVDRAWLAGLFDGEGHLALNTLLNQVGRGVKIQITNTNREILDHVIEVTGVGYITTRYHDDPKHKPTHDWHTTGGNAVEIVRRMRPWLIIKREKADTII